ncbi:hypothetical protein KIPB_008406, partial [Kipferlia bialata]|eukprot:g8406.t1
MVSGVRMGGRSSSDPFHCSPEWWGSHPQVVSVATAVVEQIWPTVEPSQVGGVVRDATALSILALGVGPLASGKGISPSGPLSIAQMGLVLAL